MEKVPGPWGDILGRWREEVNGQVADPVRIAQVLENLLTNASKYTPRGGWVRVEASETGEWIELRVSDSGMRSSQSIQSTPPFRGSPLLRRNLFTLPGPAL